MKRMNSNASIFERRGDPWVTTRDAVKQYGRNPLTEDPDLDQFTRAKQPKFTQQHAIRKASIFGAVIPPEEHKPVSDERRLQNIRMRMNRRLGQAERAKKAIKLPDRSGDFRPKSIFEKS